MLVGCASGTSKLRLGLLDENSERNFCLNPFLGDVDMARGSYGQNPQWHPLNRYPGVLDHTSPAMKVVSTKLSST